MVEENGLSRTAFKCPHLTNLPAEVDTAELVPFYWPASPSQLPHPVNPHTDQIESDEAATAAVKNTVASPISRRRVVLSFVPGDCSST